MFVVVPNSYSHQGTGQGPWSGKGVLSLIRNARGQSMIEFAIATLFVFACLFALADFVIVVFNWVVMQYSANRGAREMRLETNMSIVEARVIEIAGDVGLTVNSDEVAATIVNGDILRITIDRDVQLNGLVGLLAQISGDYSGVYTIDLVEEISRRLQTLST